MKKILVVLMLLVGGFVNICSAEIDKEKMITIFNVSLKEKEAKKEYIGRTYNNTNNGEIITIYDAYYNKWGDLWLCGITPSGKKTNAPAYQYQNWDEHGLATVAFDLRGDFQPGGAMYDTLTKEQKEMVTNAQTP